MKKMKKIYATSDFSGAVVSTIEPDKYWAIDTVNVTKEGSVSHTPLFILSLRPLQATSPSENLVLPEGWVDASIKMLKSRRYVVREGRALYTELNQMWTEAGCDKETFLDIVHSVMDTQAFAGHVERLSDIHYTKATRDGGLVDKNSMELWYPSDVDEGAIIQDYVYLCNRGVYTPILPSEEEKKAEENKTPEITPELIAAVMAALGK